MMYVFVPSDKAATMLYLFDNCIMLIPFKRGLIGTNVYKLLASLIERIVVDRHGCHTALIVVF